jgi:hypothetical protein
MKYFGFTDSNRDIVNVTFEMDDSPENVSNFETLINSCLKKFRREEIDSDNIQNCDKSNKKVTTKREVDPSSDVDYKSAEHFKESKPPENPLGKCLPQYESIQSDENNTNFLDCQNALCNSCEKSRSESDPSVEGSKAASRGHVDTGDVDQYSHHCILIGLHCCGDLTPAMLKVYSDVEFLRGLCCVSCCYHRMTKQGNITSLVLLTGI